MNVVVDGLMANYQKSGNGKAIILLHGWGDSSRTFLALTKELQANYQLFVLDLPGFGGTQAPPIAWGTNNYRDFVENWIIKLGIHPYAIIGHSYGGAIAVDLASSRQKFNKMILLASAGVRHKHQTRKSTLKAAAKIGRIPLYLLPTNQRAKFKQNIYKTIGSDAMLLPHMEETYRKIINDDIQSKAAKIDIPTLLIYGSNDKSTPPEDGRILQKNIKNSQLEIINAGHFLHQEYTTEVASLITDFLEAGA